MIDALQQRCFMTLLVSLLLTSGNLLFDVFLTSTVITILRKIAANFREVLFLLRNVNQKSVNIFSKKTGEKFILPQIFCNLRARI